jgi:DNA-binding response OmpR family regulator
VIIFGGRSPPKIITQNILLGVGKMFAIKSILVVDDESTIREVVRRYLERDGFAVREAEDGYAALDAIEETPPDLIVLDLMLPGIDGLTITRHLHGRHRIPILILTAKGDVRDRIRGLDLGADDYLTKPFSPQELVSRVRAVLRRTDQGPELATQPITFGELQLDPASRSVARSSEDVPLTTTEFDLLWFLASHPKQVFSRTQLLDKVWGYDYYGDASTVTVHISRLREKIEPDQAKPRHIITVWGVGYKFEP